MMVKCVCVCVGGGDSEEGGGSGTVPEFCVQHRMVG